MSVTRREFMVGAGALAAHGRLTGFPAPVQRRPLKVGVFISEVDAQGVDEQVEPYVTQMRTGLGLAASEINDRGGVLGRPLELIYRDDGGTPPTGVATQALIDEGCEAIVSGFVMAAPQLLTIRMRTLGTTVPVLHGFWTDGSYCGAVARHVSPTVRQIIPPIRAYLDEDAQARPFTISNWTPSGRRVSDYMYGALGGAHTGDALVTTPVRGSHHGEYRGVIRWAHEMESTIIWNADPRPYAVNAVNAAVDLGVAAGKTFVYLDFSEWQASQLVPGASIVTCIPFVASDPNSDVQEFVARAKAFSGSELVTHVAFTHYNALMTLEAAINRSGEASAAGAQAGLDRLTIETATGRITLDSAGYPTMPMFVATAEGGGKLEMVERIEQIEPGSSC